MFDVHQPIRMIISRFSFQRARFVVITSFSYIIEIVIL